MIAFKDIVAARERIRDQIYLSPCAYSETISQMTDNRVFFKLDNLQMTGSFKERGALNRLLTLTQDRTRRGVIAAGSCAAHQIDLRATLWSPRQAPRRRL